MNVPVPPGQLTVVVLVLLLQANRKANEIRAGAISSDFPALLDTTPPDNALWETIPMDDTTTSARVECWSFSQF